MPLDRREQMSSNLDIRRHPRFRVSNYVFIRGVSYPWDEYRVEQSLPVFARTLCFGVLA